jgi:hypothetical protein
MLQELALLSISVSVICAAVIVADQIFHPQKMSVMNVVWPVTALYFSVFALWTYFVWGRKQSRKTARAMPPVRVESDTEADARRVQHFGPPTTEQVAVSTSHCGAGCMIADVVCESWIASAGIVLFGSMLWAQYAMDFAAAWLLGVVFQYMAIKPMRDDLSVGGAIAAAIKADTLSIVAFQVGMYAWMALVHYKLPHLMPSNAVFWLAMQVGMIFGFATSYPINRWLIAAGLKEAM